MSLVQLADIYNHGPLRIYSTTRLEFGLLGCFINESLWVSSDAVHNVTGVIDCLYNALTKGTVTGWQPQSQSLPQRDLELLHRIEKAPIGDCYALLANTSPIAYVKDCSLYLDTNSYRDIAEFFGTLR